MKVIGITGSSGSGKSTLTKILANELNAKAIYSDEIVKKMQKKGTDYYKKIVETFGEEILNENKEINRKKLAEIIFSKEEDRNKMNEITKTYVLEEIKKQIKETKKEIVIVDAPILIESGLNKECNVIIAVICNRKTQIKRICERDNIEEKEAIARLNSQKSNEYYKKYADYIVENDGGEYDKFVGRIRASLQKL